MNDPQGYFVYDAVIDGKHRSFASLLLPDAGFAAGLPGEAVMGEFLQGPRTISPDAFRQNQTFVEFMAYAIGKHCAACPGLLAEAGRQRDGVVFVLDQRTPTPDDGVPPEDIIGAVEIRDGQMIRFRGSPKHRVLTASGFMQLDPWLKDRLVEELMLLPRDSTRTGRMSR